MGIPINQLIVGDCVEVMKTFPDECIDLVITSPPYDNLRDYKGYVFDFEAIAKELVRVIKKGGIIVWVVGDATINGSETGTSFSQALYFKSLGLNIHDTMIYEKSGTSYPSKVRYYSCFEYMFVFSKGKPKTINLIRDKKNKWGGTSCWGKPTFRQKDGTLKEEKKKTLRDYGIRNNIWRYVVGGGLSTKDKIAYKHPAIFPEALAKDHIISWSKEGDIVLDPMCGSGTTCKMAKLLNRKYIGIDIAKEYIEIAKQRLLTVPNRLI